MRLLDLLKRVQFHGASDYDECPECGRHQYDTPENTHNQGCELKAAIDLLSKFPIDLEGDGSFSIGVNPKDSEGAP